MARIESMNGRIESYKGRYGENVGPARVWLKHEQYPGLAMSRSIGDACAHSVGVSALPGKCEDNPPTATSGQPRSPILGGTFAITIGPYY